VLAAESDWWGTDPKLHLNVHLQYEPAICWFSANGRSWQ